MKRIFIAVKVKPEQSFLDLLTSFKSALSRENVKWTDINNIHVTLVFLGDTEESMIKDIGSMITDCCKGSGRFDLLMESAGVFRSMHDPRIIWTGIEPSPRLTQINVAILNGLKRLDIKLEDRPFNPHLTIGRIKHLSDKEVLANLIDKFQNIEIQKIPVDEIILYESILYQTGPIYKPLSKISLGNEHA